MFTVTLMGPPDLSPDLREDAEIRYRDVLVEIFGSEAGVVAACVAHDQVAARSPDEALPLGKTEEERAAVSRWWAADRATEMTAFVGLALHPSGVWFEVGV
jgi:hypothetical protein